MRSTVTDGRCKQHTSHVIFFSCVFWTCVHITPHTWLFLMCFWNMCAHHTWLKCRQGSGIASHKTFSSPCPCHLHDVARACVWLSSDVPLCVLISFLHFLYVLINDPFSNAVSKPRRNPAERGPRTYCAICASYSWCSVTKNFTHSISAKIITVFLVCEWHVFELKKTLILVICCRFFFLWIIDFRGRCSYEWVRGQKPRWTKQGKKLYAKQTIL